MDIFPLEIPPLIAVSLIKLKSVMIALKKSIFGNVRVQRKNVIRPLMYVSE